MFAIELSKSHVPRWFTEGLSEYETIVRRPEWRREQDPDLAMALRRGSLPSAVDMNRAFTHAESCADVTVAYYASSQLLVYTGGDLRDGPHRQRTPRLGRRDLGGARRRPAQGR